DALPIFGSVGAAGSACYNAATGTYEVEASGADIWGTADEFHYVYQSLTGDGEIIARVVSLENTNKWAKAGVMMRNGTAANAAMAIMYLSPNPSNSGPAYSLAHRSSAGAGMSPSGNNLGPVGIGSYPYYLRLVRSGNTFTGYASQTNGNWVLLGSRTITMGQTIQVGLATSATNDGVLASAVYDNVQVTSAAAGKLALGSEEVST